MDPLVWLQAKYDLDLSVKSPIEIPNVNRDTLARWFFCWAFLRGAEIGVERGAYSEILCVQNPGVELLCVDAWRAHRGYRDHVDQAKLDRFHAETGDRLKPHRGAKLVRKFSVDAAKDVPDGSLDFVYLDANHSLPSVIADLAAWSPKVRPGGIVSGHDFLKARLPSLMHVPQAIHAWTDAYQIRPWFVLGRQAKIPGELRDDGRSWFWIHEPRPVMLSRNGRPVRQ